MLSPTSEDAWLSERSGVVSSTSTTSTSPFAPVFTRRGRSTTMIAMRFCFSVGGMLSVFKITSKASMCCTQVHKCSGHNLDRLRRTTRRFVIDQPRAADPTALDDTVDAENHGSSYSAFPPSVPVLLHTRNLHAVSARTLASAMSFALAYMTVP